MRHECDTSVPPVLHDDTSATRVKILILITTLVKTYFHTLIFTLLYGKRKTAKRGTISFKELPFGNPSFPCQNRLKSAPQKLNFLMAKAVSILKEHLK